MARHSTKLSARAVAAISKPGRHRDESNLYLFLDKKGRRRWIYRYVKGGKAHELGLGGSPAVSLKEARAKAAEARKMLAAGTDPIKAKKAVAKHAATFGQCAIELLEAKAGNWRSAKHARQWRQSLETHAASLWGLAPAQIDVGAILRALQPLWIRAPETASRVQGRIENVLDAAQARGLIDAGRSNPARWKGHLDKLLSKRSQLSRGHFAAMDYLKIPECMARLKEIETPAARALEFAILTGARLGETLGATWDEIDFETKIWSVPGSRMKAGREHRIPLSGRAVGILAQMVTARSGARIFQVSPRAMRKLLPPGTTIHGFRSGLSTWATEETSFPDEIIEGCLAHSVGTQVRRTYKRGDTLEKRRLLMQAWEHYLQNISKDNVVRLSG